MQNRIKGATSAAVLSFVVAFTGVPAQASQVTLPGGAVVNYQQNNGGSSGGTVAGTIQQGGATTNFSCSYDPVSGQLSGSASCTQIAGSLNLTQLEGQIVGARVNAASALQSMSNLQILDDMLQRQLGDGTTMTMRAAGTGANASAFGSPSIGSFAFGGGSFVDDNRAGLEKNGHNYIATVGLDHTAGNTLIGAYGGYANTQLKLYSLDGNLSSDGWLAGAYVTQSFSRQFSVTLSGNYLNSDVDLNRTFTGAAVTARYGHTEWSGSFQGNLQLISTRDLALTALAGMTYGSWQDNAYTDSRGIVFNKAEGDSTYAKGGGALTFLPTSDLRPYGYATYSRLLSDPNYNGRNALEVGGGLAMGSGRFTGAIEGGTVLLQSGQSNYTIGLHLHLAV